MTVGQVRIRAGRVMLSKLPTVYYVRYMNNNREASVDILAALRLSLLKEFHDNSTSGHLGCRKTFARKCETS